MMMINSCSVKAYIRPAKHCNFACKHCFYATGTQQKQLLDIESAKRFLDLLASEYKNIKIIFHGGEPTLAGIDFFREIFLYQEKLRIEKQVSFSNILQTNGFLLDNDFIELLKYHQCSISLSFDGPHNSDLRPHTDKIWELIKQLRYKKSPFGVICVETQKSIFNLKQTYQWFKDKKINYKILAIQSRGFAKNSSFELSVDDYIKNLISLYKFWLEDKDCNIKVTTFLEFLRLQRTNVYKENWSTKNRFALNSDGLIYVYGYPNEENFPIGDIKTCDKLSSLYNSKNYKDFQNIINNEIQNRCINCSCFSTCGANSIYTSFLYDTNKDSIDYSCNLTQATIKEVLKINDKILYNFENQNISKYNKYVQQFYYEIKK